MTVGPCSKQFNLCFISLLAYDVIQQDEEESTTKFALKSSTTMRVVVKFLHHDASCNT